MGYVLLNEAHLETIADAIRTKSGTVKGYKPRDMAEAILLLDSTATQEDWSQYNKNYITQMEYDYGIIPKDAFRGLQKLRVFRSEAITVGLQAFYGCNIKHMYLRNAINVGRIDETTVITAYGPFAGCDIQHIDLGEDIEYINLCDIASTEFDMVIRKFRLEKDETFDLPTLVMDSVPADQRHGYTVYVPAAVKHFYEEFVAENPNSDWATFGFATIEGSKYETFGGDLD